MSNQYIEGGSVRCQATFANSAGTAVDPTAVVFKFKNPAGTVVTYTYDVDVELVRASTGVYYVDVNANAEGVWYYRFASTGTGQAANEDNFIVEDTWSD